MLFPAVVVMAALAGPAVAEPSMRFSRMTTTRDLFGLGRRDEDAAYTPATTFCGVGTTCAEACGAGFEMCGKIPEQTRCYNPTAGETCCAEGLSCEKGYSCSAKGDMCLPGEALVVPSAQYVAAAMTTTAPVAASAASSAEPATFSVLSSSSLATASSTSSTSSPLSALSVASSSASLSHASIEECTQTTAVVVVPTPIAGNTTTVQNGPTGSSASQTIQPTFTHSFSGSRPAPTASNSTVASTPSVVPANPANRHQGPALAVLLGAVVLPALGL